MSEADIEIDLTATARDGPDEQRDLTDRERDLRKTFGYKKALVQPSQILGTGSYGNVVKATLDGLPCAAKILHPTFFTSNDPDVMKFTQRFQLECRILRQLKHPCIVQFLGVFDDPRPRSGGRPILLMELMEESLTHFLESGQKALPYHIQVNITYDIALALDYLHANGIQHRDLSSNNILLIATRAKLTDFGMSKMVEINPRMSLARNKHTMCPGTLAFMPPETLLPEPIYSNKIDVFSTGVLMVQIVTRRFPKPGDAHRAERDAKQRKLLVPIPELERRKDDLRGVFMTHPLRPIALNCLKDEEGDRPTAADLCQLLVRLKATPEYATSSSEYHQQVIALPPTKSAREMRDAEIAVLNGEIESLTLEKSKARGIFRKKDTSKLDADIADLRRRKQPLVAERECEQEEERERVEHENENTWLKERVEELEITVVSENAELKRYIERLEREKEAALSENTELHQLKQIFQTQVHVAPQRKHQRSRSLPPSWLFSQEMMS